MKWRPLGAIVVCLFLTSAGLLCLSSQASWAQDNAPLQAPNDKIVDVEFDNVEIGKALRELFKLSGAHYEVDKDVQGTVSISLRRVRFETALQNTLRQVNATWRETKGTYRIVLKPQDPPYSPIEPSEDEPVDVRNVIGALFQKVGASYTISPQIEGMVSTKGLNKMTFEAALQNLLKDINATYRVEGGVYEILPKKSPDQDPGKYHITIQVQDVDIREALRTMFKQVDLPYSVAPDVQGNVTAHFANISLEAALGSILGQVDANFRKEQGVFVISRKPRPLGDTPDPTDYSRRLLDSSAPVISQDNRFLYILKGDILYKINKSDLKTVAKRQLGT